MELQFEGRRAAEGEMETPTTPVLDPSLERSNSTNYAGSEKSNDKNYTRSARSSFGSRNGDYGDLDLAQLRHSRSQKDSGLVTFKKSFESHRPSLGKFGSQNSVSALDMIANGLDVEDIPYYDLFVRNLSYKVNESSWRFELQICTTSMSILMRVPDPAIVLSYRAPRLKSGPTRFGLRSCLAVNSVNA